MFMDNSRISYVYLSTEDSHPHPITFSLVITLIEANSHWRPFVSSFVTRFNIPRTFSFSEGTMNRPESTESTASTMNASVDIPSNCGKSSRTYSTAYPSAHSSMKKYSACTVDSVPKWRACNKLPICKDHATFPMLGSCVISYGAIPIPEFMDGQKTIEVCPSFSGLTWLPHSWKNMIWTYWSELIRLSKMDTNSSQEEGSSPFSRHPTTVGNSIMLVA
mmetsp:Transcript_15760/g.22413  ORF Transcript_15760/g.22413 Transcript_15760/m.22413 type:complete len:219 (-) Transcript_15760:365-1021(-)